MFNSYQHRERTMARTTEGLRNFKSDHTTRVDGNQSATSDHERRKMIEESAYFRAQRRGFVGGSPVEDWLAAERETRLKTETR
jgi:hypothetical protein